MPYRIRYSNSLCHHGIKGQKWGIRRYQNEDGSYTAEGKERYGIKSGNNESVSNGEEKKSSFDLRNLTPEQKEAIKKGAMIVGGAILVGGGLYLASKYVDQYKLPMMGIKHVRVGEKLTDRIKEFSDNPVHLPKDTTFQRLSSEALEDYENTGQIYVSHILNDNNAYKMRIGNRAPFVHKLKVNTDIKAPSEKETAEVFLKFNPKATSEEFDFFMTRAFLHENSGIKDIVGVNRNEFVNEIKKRGYNALIDTNDKIWTKDPLILLNPSEFVISDKVSSIGKFEKVMFELANLF